MKETRVCAGWRVGEVLRLYEELMKETVLKQERDWDKIRNFSERINNFLN